MASTTAGEGTSYEGGAGAGGKFRKKPSRRSQTTPYDRPPTAFRNPRDNGWLPKLVDPAYKLICSSAQMFFSSVFRKRLPPPPPPVPPPPPALSQPEANKESRDVLQVAVPNNTPGVQEPARDGNDGPINNIDGSGFSELEQLLKKKTFTRSEIDYLTELLHSRTVDFPNGDEEKRSESNILCHLSLSQRQDGLAGGLIEENRTGTCIESPRFHGRISTPGVSSQGLQDDIASPAELAKAYMGSRPSKVSPSMLGTRGQALREESSVLSNGPFPLKSHGRSLVTKPSARIGVPENGFITPRSRGRSLIYNMARTPYSRVNTNVTQKGNDSPHDGYGGPSTLSSSKHAWEYDGSHGSKQSALKRRSSVLEDDIGSLGPIRRLRQKTNLLASKKLSLAASGSPLSARRSGFGIEISQPSTSSTKKLLTLDETKHGMSRMVGENEDNSMPSTSYTPVPSKSTEMATRILEQLEKLVPKEKSAEGKAVVTSENSLRKMTQNILHGRARRSLEDVDSLKMQQNSQDGQKLEVLHSNSAPIPQEPTSQLQANAEENGPQNYVISHEMFASSMNDTTVSVRESENGAKTTDSVIDLFLTQPQKKHAFQISAHEELEDDMHSKRASPLLLGEGKEKSETSLMENRTSTAAVTLNKTPAVTEVKPPTNSDIRNSTVFVTPNASVIDNKHVGLNFSTAPASSSNFQPVFVTSQSASTLDTIGSHKEHSAAPFSFRSSHENVDKIKIPPPAFSSSSLISQSSAQNSGVSSETKADNSNSSGNATLGAIDTKIAECDKVDNKNTQKSGNVIGRLDSSSSSAAASVSAGRFFSFGASANNPSLNNGSQSSSSSSFSTTSILTSNPFTSSFTSGASSTTASMTSNGTSVASALDKSVSTSGAALFSATPVFKFGSTTAAASNTTSEPLMTSTAETDEVKAKTDKQITSGNLSSSPFGGMSFVTASTGTSVFGASVSALSSAKNDLSKGSPFGTGNGSLVSNMPVTSVTQNMPIQFGSSSSSSIFGTSGTPSFTSGSFMFGSSTSGSSLFGSLTSSSSLFGSSAPSPVFGSNNSFGQSTMASSSEASAASSSGASSSLFGSTWQPSKSLTSATASITAPIVFGSSVSASSSSFFSFTSAGAGAATAASSQTQPIFGSSPPTFAATSGNGDVMNMEDSMAEDPVQALPPPAAPVFGQTPMSIPSSPFGFGSTPPAVPFQFGGQQNQSMPQNPSPFQASNSLELNAGGNFSLGSGGGDKSNRKIVKVKRTNRKK